MKDTHEANLPTEENGKLEETKARKQHRKTRRRKL